MFSFRSLVFVLCSISFFPLHASSLPPEHEAARLMLAVEELVNEGQWERASVHLEAMKDLNVVLAEEFYFYHGKVLKELSQYANAVTSLEQYVVKAGQEGRFYSQALALITRIEEQSESVEQAEQLATKRRIQPEIKGADDGYIKSLQALYLTADPVSALLQQINSLLSVHVYTGSRLKTSDGREGIKYSLAVNRHELLLQKKSYENRQPLLTVEKLNVLGVDPFVEYGCSATEFLCFLYHPSKANEQWIKLDRDELVAGELSQAFSKLIRLLQQQ